MARGRPSKYKPEYCEEIIKFFDYSPYREVEIPHYQAGKLQYKDTKLLPNEPRFISDFAHSIGVHIDTLYEWAKKYPEFSEALKIANSKNQNIHIKGAYMGVYNPTSFVFTMKNIAGWRDNRDVKHSIGEDMDGAEISIKIIKNQKEEEGEKENRDSSK